MTQKELFNIIEVERGKRGFTLIAFCRAIKVSKTSYQDWRVGRVSMNAGALLRMLDVLGMQITTK